MGCASSTNADSAGQASNATAKEASTTAGTGTSADENAVRAQRRRLSVAPQHVGDMMGNKPQPNRASIIDNTSQGALSELELKAKGSMHHAVVSRKGYVSQMCNTAAVAAARERVPQRAHKISKHAKDDRNKRTKHHFNKVERCLISAFFFSPCVLLLLPAVCCVMPGAVQQEQGESRSIHNQVCNRR